MPQAGLTIRHDEPDPLLEVVDLQGGEIGFPSGRIIVGIGRGNIGVCDDHAAFDILLCEEPAPPAPWIGTRDVDSAIANLQSAAAKNPIAATTLATVLRHSADISFEVALTMESLAYSMLLAGREFSRWREMTPRRTRAAATTPRVRLEMGEALRIVLSRPHARNALDARMRDELVDAFEFALAESSTRDIVLMGDGPAFCAGGDLDEFGTATDVAAAHLIRMQQSPVNLLHKLSRRVTARLHGACIGAGIELPAAAAKIVAARNSWFRLPEVSMGLIPGAGGTVTITRRIGRHRTCFLALTGEKLDAETALAWGLIDELA